MAAIETFDWVVQQVWPSPDAGTAAYLKEQRDELFSIRNENERVLYVDGFLAHIRELKRQTK